MLVVRVSIASEVASAGSATSHAVQASRNVPRSRGVVGGGRVRQSSVFERGMTIVRSPVAYSDQSAPGNLKDAVPLSAGSTNM